MIKKMFVILLIVSIIFILSSCKNTIALEKETSPETIPSKETTVVEITETLEEPETIEETEEEISIVETTEEEIKKEFSPIITGNISIFGFPCNVCVVEEYAYIAGQGLNIIDIKDRENPKMVGMFHGNAWWRVGFYVEGNFAYFPFENFDSEGNSLGGVLQVIDITDKKNAKVVGMVEFEERIKDVWVIENYIYATYEILREKSGIHVIDVSDKKNPIIVGSYETGNLSIYSIRIDGNYLYVLVGDTLKIIDISDRENLVKMGNCPISKTTIDFFVEGNYLYLPFDNSLQIIDVSDKENPTMTVDILAAGEVTDVFVKNNNAFITYVIRNSEDQVEKSGIQIIDVEDKNNSTIVAELEIPGQAMAIFIDGDYAYIGSGPQAGLQIIKLFNE